MATVDSVHHDRILQLAIRSSLSNTRSSVCTQVVIASCNISHCVPESGWMSSRKPSSPWAPLPLGCVGSFCSLHSRGSARPVGRCLLRLHVPGLAPARLFRPCESPAPFAIPYRSYDLRSGAEQNQLAASHVVCNSPRPRAGGRLLKFFHGYVRDIDHRDRDPFRSDIHHHLHMCRPFGLLVAVRWFCCIMCGGLAHLAKPCCRRGGTVAHLAFLVAQRRSR